jgi:SSS family solute:Na+ symporter
MNFTFNLGVIDLVTILLFLVVMVTLGCWVGWKQRRSALGSDYFLASRSLIWPWIGFSLFSTNISAIELVGLAQEGYRSGLVYGNLEWMAALTLVILAIFFAPFYIRSEVATLPDFLLKRYNNSCRVFEVVVAIFTAIFIHTGFALFAGAKVMQGLFNMPIMASITIILCLTGLYTMIGGLKGVVLTDSVATVILISGSIVMAAVGFYQVGGWEGLTTRVEPNMLHMLRSYEVAKATNAPDMSWYGVFLGYPIIGIWYFCTDQTIVQRVLGAKNEKHAQMGPIFAGFIKILPVFIFVMPGLICFALIRQGEMDALPPGADGRPDTALTYAHMVTQILPMGVRGLVAAALLAALMSTLSSALNSIATVFCYDIYKPMWPAASDRELIRVGRIITVAAMLFAIAWASQIGKFGSILEANTAMICYVAPAITAVFLGGVLWRGASAKGAFITLCAGTAMGAMVFVIDFWSEFWETIFGWKWDYSYMMVAFWLFVVCCVILYLASRLYPHEHTAESEKLVWANLLAALRQPGWSGLANYKFLAMLLLGTMVLFYTLFQLI